MHDVSEIANLIRDDEVVYGDSGYFGAVNQLAARDDEKKSKIEFRMNIYPFLIVKRQMGYAKVIYRGLAKNMNRFHILFASADLLMCSRLFLDFQKLGKLE